MRVLKDLYFLEYSSKQKCFHIDEVNLLVRKNLNQLLAGRGDALSYVPVFIGTYEEVCNAARAIEEEINYESPVDKFFREHPEQF